MLDLILLFCFKGAGDSAVMSHLAGRSSLLLSSFCLIFLPAEFFIWGPTTSLLLLKDEQQSNAHSSLNKPDSLQAYKEDKNCPLSPEQESHLLLNRIFLSKVQQWLQGQKRRQCECCHYVGLCSLTPRSSLESQGFSFTLLLLLLNSSGIMKS